MIINLVGPPCGGKSGFAARFTLEHPQFRYCPIDEYRIQYEGDEARAWHELSKDVLNKRNCIIESCGMGWRLGELLDLPKIRRRPLVTIALMGNRMELRERLADRQHKRPLPPPYIPTDEFIALDYALEHFQKEVMSVVDYMVDTTIFDKEQVYHDVNTFIQRELLFTKGRRHFRDKYVFKKYPFRRKNQRTRACEL